MLDTCQKDRKGNMAPGQWHPPLRPLILCSRPLILCSRPPRVFSTSSCNVYPASSWTMEAGLWAVSHKKEHTKGRPGRTRHSILLGSRGAANWTGCRKPYKS